MPTKRRPRRNTNLSQPNAAVINARYSRNKSSSIKDREFLDRNNCKLVSVLESLDDSPETSILESMLVGMAEYFSKNLAREVRKG